MHQRMSHMVKQEKSLLFGKMFLRLIQVQFYRLIDLSVIHFCLLVISNLGSLVADLNIDARLARPSTLIIFFFSDLNISKASCRSDLGTPFLFSIDLNFIQLTSASNATFGTLNSPSTFGINELYSR